MTASQPPGFVRSHESRSGHPHPDRSAAGHQRFTGVPPGRPPDPAAVQRLVGNRALSGLLAPAAKTAPAQPVTGPGVAHARDELTAGLPAALGGRGSALEPRIRAMMEAGLGHGLGRVRVHTGPDAAASARRLDARAYTVGDDIVLGESVEPLDSLAGRRTVAHELVHVVQQRLGGPAPETGADADAEQDAQRIGLALAEGRPIDRIRRGTAVGVARQPVDARHARGHAGEQTMGFGLYRQEDGWIFFEGPSGSAGHGTTAPGFDGVAYNVNTGEIHLLDNKSLKATGSVYSATAIDPARNLGKNVDTLIQRVEAAKDVPGRVRLLGRLRALKASLAAGTKLPDDVKLVVTSQGGRTTDVSPRLKAAGVQHRSDPPPKTAAAAPAHTPPQQEPLATPPPTSTPKPHATPVPAVVEPTQTTAPTPPVVEQVPVPPQLPKPVVEYAPTPVVTPPARPVSAWRAGLKAGGKAIVVALIFAGLDYWVHKRLEADLEDSINQSRVGALPWALRVKQQDPSKPVYLRVKVESREYSRYLPLLGWLPESPVLHMTQIAMVREEIDPPIVEVHDNRLDIWHPGVTTEVTYTEPMVP